MVHRALAEAIEFFRSGLEKCTRSEDRALIERYLTALGPVLSGAVLGKDVLERVRQVERLFGQTWLIDPGPFAPAVAKWGEFAQEYQRFVVRGMTVNERLHAFSLSEDYERAIVNRDAEAVREILNTVHVDDQSIEKILARMDKS